MIALRVRLQIYTRGKDPRDYTRAITRNNDTSSLRHLIPALFDSETPFLLHTKRGNKRSHYLHSCNDLHLGLLRRYYSRRQQVFIRWIRVTRISMTIVSASVMG